MPNGAPSMEPEPKSGWACAVAPMLATHAPESRLTGSLDTSACQTLSAGKIVQPVGALLAEGETLPRPASAASDAGGGDAGDDDGGAEDAPGAAVPEWDEQPASSTDTTRIAAMGFMTPHATV